jgi:hypothetical protein
MDSRMCKDILRISRENSSVFNENYKINKSKYYIIFLMSQAAVL